MRIFAPAFLLNAAHAEISGPDTVYIPTTQVQIKPNGDWHRRGPVDHQTACGEKYEICAWREYEIVGNLCPSCSTPHERQLAAENNSRLAREAQKRET